MKVHVQGYVAGEWLGQYLDLQRLMPGIRNWFTASVISAKKKTAVLKVYKKGGGDFQIQEY